MIEMSFQQLLQQHYVETGILCDLVSPTKKLYVEVNMYVTL